MQTRTPTFPRPRRGRGTGGGGRNLQNFHNPIKFYPARYILCTPLRGRRTYRSRALQGQGGGQVVPPALAERRPASAPTTTAERAPPRGEARAKGAARAARDAGPHHQPRPRANPPRPQRPGTPARRDPARRRGGPHLPTDKHARDHDQGGAGGQQTDGPIGDGDLRTRGGASRPRPAPHRRSPEQAERHRGKAAGGGADELPRGVPQ